MRACWIFLMCLAHQSPSLAASPDLALRTEICGEIQRLGNLGKLEDAKLVGEAMTRETLAEYVGLEQGIISIYRAAWIDTDGDGTPEPWGYSIGGGTCSTNIVVLLDPAKPLAPIARVFKGWSEQQIENDDVLRWSAWGTSEAFYRVSDVPIIIATSAGSPRLAMLVDGGERVPLCAFVEVGNPRLSIVESRNQDLCAAVASGAVRYLERGMDFAQPQTEVDYFGLFVDGEAGIQVDLDNNGEHELLRDFVYHSGAGCGSSHRWLAEVDAEGLPVDTLLNTLLSPLAPERRYARAESSGQIFERFGKVHLVGQLASDSGVFTIEGSSVQIQCVVQTIPQVQISRMY